MRNLSDSITIETGPHLLLSTSIVLGMETPFQEIINTNIVPSEEQCDNIRVFLARPCSILAKLDVEIERIRELLDTTVQKRDELDQFIASHTALLSPMRRIPDDILQLIFLETLPEHRNTALDAREGPLLLASVCHHWRVLAFSTPQLWSRMHLIVPLASTAVNPAIEKLDLKAAFVSELQCWLERGAIVPLNIDTHKYHERILFVHPDEVIAPVIAENATSSYLSALLAVSNRWRNVRFSCHLSLADIEALLKLTANDVPQLEHFELSSFSVPSGGNRDLQLKLLSTPSLRSIAFYGLFADIPRTVQWQNLVELHLQLDHLFDDGPLSFLSQCTSLERLSIVLPSTPTGMHPQSTFEDVVLPSLTALVLCLGPHWQANGITRPNLFDDDTITALLGAMGHIKCLSIPTLALTSDEVVAFLRMVPLLERLRLVEEPTPDDQEYAYEHHRDGRLLRHLILLRGSEVICPLLQHLEWTSINALSDDLLLQFIRSRTLPLVASYPGTAQLASFSAHFNREQLLDVSDQLADAISRGFQLDLTYLLSSGPPRSLKYSPLQGTEHDPEAIWISAQPRERFRPLAPSKYR
ncbi:F-box domain-containing protein [Mycena indigotica]|uniref:F-box domain-containing protein n=1 Tax=Mycena indigotica TaxID=2126181 RepID=A0A8H6SHN4_9AGAR|nr:F-box domain-containing protein [Mycena indigotica]KAF7298527.1 F-box domain-containing protein [Mycena indigotica]